MSRSAATRVRGCRLQNGVTLARVYYATEWALRHADVPFYATQLGRELKIPRRENACRLARLMEQAGIVRRLPATITTRNLYMPTAYAEDWLAGFRRTRGVPILVPSLSRPADPLGRPGYRVRYVK